MHLSRFRKDNNVADPFNFRWGMCRAPHKWQTTTAPPISIAALRRQMGQAGAAHAKQHFGLPRQVDQLLAWYEEVYEDWQRQQTS